MHYTPEPYQKLMRDHLVTHERAAAFVGLGLGKTASTLSAIASLKAMGEIRSALVIAPLRVANLTWPNEIRKWDQFAAWKVENLRRSPPSGEADIYTVNYESLHRLPSLEFTDLVVFDELTRVKDPTGRRMREFLPTLMKRSAIWRWGLTGTPRPNSLLELFAQIRALDDGQRLGRSFDMFRSTWFYPEDYLEYRWLPKPESERKIYERIADMVITLRSSDFLDVPETRVEDIEVPLSKLAFDLYRELEKELIAQLGSGETIVASNAAVLVNKLIQVCSGAIYNEQRGVIDIHPNKIRALRRLLEGMPEERTIIATNYIHERVRICQSIFGAVDAHEFQGDIEDAWNSGRIRHLVADARSLGHGLNLQGGGRTVVWFTPTWSRELYDQYNARVIRKGQKAETRIYRLVTPATIEDAVIETLRIRGDEQSAMLAVLDNFRRMGATFF